MEGKCYFCNEKVNNKTVKRHVKTCKIFRGSNDGRAIEAKKTKKRYIIKLNFLKHIKIMKMLKIIN